MKLCLILNLCAVFAAETSCDENLPIFPDEMMDLIASHADLSLLKSFMGTSKNMAKIAEAYVFKDFLREKLVGSAEKEIDLGKILDVVYKKDESDKEEARELMSMVERKQGKNLLNVCMSITEKVKAKHVLALIHPNYSLLPFIVEYFYPRANRELIPLFAKLSGYDDITIKMIKRVAADHEMLSLCENLILLRGRGPVVEACLARLDESDALNLIPALGPVELKNMDCLDLEYFPNSLITAFGGIANFLDYVNNVGASEEQISDLVHGWLQIRSETENVAPGFIQELLKVILKVGHIRECTNACIAAFSEVWENARVSGDDELEMKISILLFISNLDRDSSVGLITDLFGTVFCREELEWFLENWQDFQPHGCNECEENIIRIIGPLL